MSAGRACSPKPRCVHVDCDKTIWTRHLCYRHYTELLTGHTPTTVIFLDVEPMRRWMCRLDVKISLMGPALARAWQRACRSGQISEDHADRIARVALGMVVEDIYGWDTEVAS